MLSKQKNNLVSIGLFIAILVVAAIILLNEQYWYFWAMIAVVGAIILGSSYKKTNPNKILILLAALNIVFDSLAVAIWAVFPSTQWSIYQLGFPIVGTEAGVAA